MVKYLAGLTGTKVIRINNHEYTDLQEYVGSYCVGPNDKLVFKEGQYCFYTLILFLEINFVLDLFII